MGNAVVQDATAGIYVSVDGHTLDLELANGSSWRRDRSAGDFAPIIAHPLRNLGRAPFASRSDVPLKAVDSASWTVSGFRVRHCNTRWNFRTASDHESLDDGAPF